MMVIEGAWIVVGISVLFIVGGLILALYYRFRDRSEGRE